MGIRGIDHVEVWAKDLHESVAFYTQVLGFQHLRTTAAQRPGGGVHEQACVTLGDMMVEFIAAPPERKTPSPSAGEAGRGQVDVGSMGVKAFALTVDDMAATAARLKEQGVRFVQEPKPGSSFNGWRAEILDPNGIGIELREWIDDSIHNPDWTPNSPTVTRTA